MEVKWYCYVLSVLALILLYVGFNYFIADHAKWYKVRFNWLRILAVRIFTDLEVRILAGGNVQFYNGHLIARKVDVRLAEARLSGFIVIPLIVAIPVILYFT